jgi:hypothetical protein
MISLWRDINHIQQLKHHYQTKIITMITLSILSLIWAIVSYYRINKTCKELDIDFDPFMGTFFDYLGLIVGTLVLVLFILAVIVIYLP